MTIEELNKLIHEELKAYLNENEEEVDAPEGDGDDDIEVTTDEPAIDSGDEAMETLRQIYDMLKPVVEPEEEPEIDAGDEEIEDEEAEGGDEEDEGEEEIDENLEEDKENLNESFDATSRFKKLANIK